MKTTRRFAACGAAWRFSPVRCAVQRVPRHANLRARERRPLDTSWPPASPRSNEFVPAQQNVFRLALASAPPRGIFGAERVSYNDTIGNS